MKLEHQVINDEKGFKHRLVPSGTPLEETKYIWAGYSSPSAFYTTKGTFIAVTEFYRGSVEFPNPDKIYWVREAPRDI